MIIVKSTRFSQLMISLFGATALMMACFGVFLFPIGLIFLCAGLPLAIVFFLWAWVPETRFDENGVMQRNLFFQTKTLAWGAVEKAHFDSYQRETREEDGWTRREGHRVIELQGGGVTIRLDQLERDTRTWWDNVATLIRQKVSTEKIA